MSETSSVLFQFLRAIDAFTLELGSPLLRFGVSLGDLSLEFSLCILFLLELFAELFAFQLVVSGLNFF